MLHLDVPVNSTFDDTGELKNVQLPTSKKKTENTNKKLDFLVRN